MGSTESNGHTQENEDYDHTRQHIEQKEVRSVQEFIVFEQLTDKAERTESQLIGGHRERQSRKLFSNTRQSLRRSRNMWKQHRRRSLDGLLHGKKSQQKHGMRKIRETMRRDTQIKRVIPEKLSTISEPKKVTKKKLVQDSPP